MTRLYPGTLTLRSERQSARMSKITNDGLTRSGTGCFIAVPIWQQWASKGWRKSTCTLSIGYTQSHSLSRRQGIFPG